MNLRRVPLRPPRGPPRPSSRAGPRPPGLGFFPCRAWAGAGPREPAEHSRKRRGPAGAERGQASGPGRSGPSTDRAWAPAAAPLWAQPPPGKLPEVFKYLSQAGERSSAWAPTFSSSERLSALLLGWQHETCEMGLERNQIVWGTGTGTDSPAKILFF